MKNPIQKFANLLPVFALSGLCLVQPGCTLLEPKADPTRLYVLRAGPGIQAAEPESRPVVPVVRVGPGRVATYLDVTPIVVQAGPNRVEQLDIDHWAEPLSKGVSRAFGEYLARRLNGAQMVLYPDPATGATLAVHYSVNRLEGPLKGAVALDVTWQVVDLASGDVLHASRTVREIPDSTGAADVSAYVERISTAIGFWADDVAAAIRATRHDSTEAK